MGFNSSFATKQIKTIMRKITNKIYNWITYIILLGIYIVFVMGAITFIKWSLFKIGVL